MATHSWILPWEISWTEEPGGLEFTWSQRVRRDLATKQQQLGPHFKEPISWFTAQPLRLEIRSQSCQNIFLFLLWVWDGPKPRVQSEALISLLPVWILPHLFWYDGELVSEAAEACRSSRDTAKPPVILPRGPWSQSPTAAFLRSHVLCTEKFKLSTYTPDHKDTCSEEQAQTTAPTCAALRGRGEPHAWGRHVLLVRQRGAGAWALMLLPR